MPPKHKGFNMRTKSGSSANPHRSTDGIRQNGGTLRDKVSCEGVCTRVGVMLVVLWMSQTQSRLLYTPEYNCSVRELYK